MPPQVPSSNLEAVLRAVSRFPGDASVGKLLAAARLNLSKRTLQRRLDELVAQGRLVPTGEGRARRYLLPPSEAPPPESELRVDRPDWLSPKAAEVRALVSRPISERTPVGYRGGFLDAYLPNKTFYLPAQTRKLLADLGQVGLADLPAGTYLRQILDRLLIDLSWNSSRLEGNTYSLLETQRLLELGESAEGRAAQETQMILNHKAAIEMLANQAEGIGFNRYTICNLHALLSDNLLADPAAGGRVRSRPVAIGGTVYHPLEVPQQIEERLDQILTKAGDITDPFEQALFVMVHLPYLQPFEDVNKRVSRLAANIPLIRLNLCPLSFVDVAQTDYVGGILGVYELNRVEYLRDVFEWAYKRSCARYTAVRQSLGDPDPFRLRHRSAIGRLVREVVSGRMDKRAAAKWIEAEVARELPKAERAKLAEVVETELGCLHMGNIARHRISPSEFDRWKAGWM